MNTFISPSIPTIQKHWLWMVANLGALFPLAWLIWDYTQGNLSVNPIADITTRTGKAALILLVLSLACTPVNILLGFAPVLNLRKSLGLWAFAYVSLHLLNFVGLDYAFNLQQIFGDALLDKRYILVGLAAFLLLTPLAITSTRGWMKRLGRNWKRLHRLVYLVGGLAVLHFLWLVKPSRLYEPLLYGVLVAFLLLLRTTRTRQTVTQWRRSLLGEKPTAPTRKPRPMATHIA
jgi:sulfoxide reductase heme-binding subunit YedZ